MLFEKEVEIMSLAACHKKCKKEDLKLEAVKVVVSNNFMAKTHKFLLIVYLNLAMLN